MHRPHGVSATFGSGWLVSPVSTTVSAAIKLLLEALAKPDRVSILWSKLWSRAVAGVRERCCDAGCYAVTFSSVGHWCCWNRNIAWCFGGVQRQKLGSGEWPSPGKAGQVQYDTK